MARLLVKFVAALGFLASAPAAAQPQSPAAPQANGQISCPMGGYGMNGGMTGAGMAGQGMANWQQMHDQMTAMQGQMTAMHAQMQAIHDDMMKLRQQMHPEH